MIPPAPQTTLNERSMLCHMCGYVWASVNHEPRAPPVIPIKPLSVTDGEMPRMHSRQVLPAAASLQLQLCPGHHHSNLGRPHHSRTHCPAALPPPAGAAALLLAACPARQRSQRVQCSGGRLLKLLCSQAPCRNRAAARASKARNRQHTALGPCCWQQLPRRPLLLASQAPGGKTTRHHC